MNKLIYALLSLPLMVFACGGSMTQDSQSNTSFAQPSTFGSTTKMVAQPTAMANNGELVSKIKDKLKGGWFGKSFEAVDVNADNGVVTISGVVLSEQDKQDVENKVKEIPEVKQVNNQLQVNPNATVAKPKSMF